MRRTWLAWFLGMAWLLQACQHPAARPAAMDDPHDFRVVINHAKERVFPAVVFIKVVSENYEAGKRITHEAAGSGVIISPEGLVLTNWHVVDKAVEVRCLLYDGQALEGKVLGSERCRSGAGAIAAGHGRGDHGPGRPNDSRQPESRPFSLCGAGRFAAAA